MNLEPEGPGSQGAGDGGEARRAETAELVAMLRARGEKVRDDAEERLLRLAGAIERWNAVINLVSRKDIGRLVDYHFCDAASLLPLLNTGRPLEALDVGGSNGLPGLVLGALSPNLEFLVCDSRQKRRAFLEEVCCEDGASAVALGRFEIARVDSLAFQDEHAGGFDLIVARAVTKLRPLLRWCLPLLRPGGRLVAYKGSRVEEEVREAQGYFLDHGGEMMAIVGSPLADTCNPLRTFAIAARRGVETPNS